MIVDYVSNLYNSILQVIDFVVGRTSDTMADIMIRALPLLAPLPNAISVFYVVQHPPLNYNTLQAFGAAAALECMFFALTEVALKMWDGVQTDRRYIYALRVMVALFVGYFVLVIAMVASLEVRHGNYAPLAFPFVSVVAALTLGCERWHKRNVATVHPVQKKTAHDAKRERNMSANTSVDERKNERNVSANPDKLQRALQLKSEGLTNAQIGKEIDMHRNSVGKLLQSANGHEAH